ncbi:hypothetical protein B0H13DRAFT_1899998 [Mycena leptocephala]|nr:hypothetical protein B0H13DRAFT_1899998 [Mycena leptocephala]
MFGTGPISLLLTFEEASERSKTRGSQQKVNLKRSLASAREDVAEYKATPDVSKCTEAAIGIKTIPRTESGRFSGGVYPGEFTQYDIDLAILLYELGGGSAVPIGVSSGPNYVLTMSMSLRFPKILRPCSGYMRKEPRRPPGSHQDLRTYSETVEAAVTAVKEGKDHIAHETTVGAISHLSRQDYGAKPEFIGPTCKKGNWRSMLETVQCVLEAWKNSPDGEAEHGPIQNIASDGDYGRRIALFMLCMHSEIIP